jgi:hypothetical protein
MWPIGFKIKDTELKQQCRCMKDTFIYFRFMQIYIWVAGGNRELSILK